MSVQRFDQFRKREISELEIFDRVISRRTLTTHICIFAASIPSISFDLEYTRISAFLSPHIKNASFTFMFFYEDTGT